MSKARLSAAALSTYQNHFPQMEAMERRRLLSVAVNSGVLTLTGSDSADVYVVALDGLNITVVENGGGPQSFSSTSVDSILANLGGGSDSIRIADAILENSVLKGDAGNDTLMGGGGADTLDGGSGDDLLDGGAGSDTVSYTSRATPITAMLHVGYSRNLPSQPDVSVTGQGGEAGEADLYTNVETLWGGSRGDTFSIDADTFASPSDSDPNPQPPPLRLNGNGGNDVLEVGGSYGVTGANGFPIYTVDGGAGNDDITARDVGGGTSTTLIGGTGDDLFKLYSDDRAVIDAGDGFDTFDFRPVLLESYTMPAGLEKLIISGRADIVGNELDNVIEGSARSIDGAGGNDLITLTNTSEASINGGDGADTIIVAVGNFTLRGGAGDDVIRVNELGAAENVGTATADIDGGDGDDLITIVGSTDYVRGGDGNDTVYAGVGDDRIYGDAGDDRLNGDGGKDTLYGGEGDDRLYGASGADRLFGDAGVDRLYGGNKNDYLDGGAGADYIKGDEDTDTAKKDNKDRRYEGVEVFV